MNEDTEKLEYIQRMQTSLINSGLWCSCINCENWKKDEWRCLHFQQTPPANIIAVGCKEWVYDIPF